MPLSVEECSKLPDFLQKRGAWYVTSPPEHEDNNQPNENSGRVTVRGHHEPSKVQDQRNSNKRYAVYMPSEQKLEDSDVRKSVGRQRDAECSNLLFPPQTHEKSDTQSSTHQEVVHRSKSLHPRDRNKRRAWHVSSDQEGDPGPR